MDNNKLKNYNTKSEEWFKIMYNKKIEDLHADNKKIGSVLNYLDYNSFFNKYKTSIGKRYIKLNIYDLGFNIFYGESFKKSIFYKIIKEIDENFDNKDYSYKDSLLYQELKENKVTTLSEYFKLDEHNNLEKYSKFYDFLPWDKKFKLTANKLCGPVSDNLINMHFIKFKRTLEGIKNFGIKYNEKNMISGYILKNNNYKKLVVTSGIHRTITIKYLFEINELNTKNIICEKTHEINLSDVNEWIHVKNGYISKENAIKIFNHLYNI